MTKTRKNTIMTIFELTAKEREWLARYGNMRAYVSRLIKKDMERKAEASKEGEGIKPGR
jgi:hypothetical protein